ncbi:MAG: uroporphyrinogen decarboxylase family protein [Planctomycetota bacterium]
MNSRQIIQAVLDFANPPRIGMTLPDPYPDDLLILSRKGADPVPLPPQGNEHTRSKDEWGVVWASLTDYDKGEVVAGALPDWSSLARYEPPDLGKAEDYAEAARLFAAEKERFRAGTLPGFTFNVARKLRKLENYLCDLVLEREHVLCLNELVRAEILKSIEQWAAAGADAVFFCEDWGTQDRLMISPEMWREVFRREFEILAGRAKELGMYVLMHSCGKMTAIVEDLIECGVSCLQFDQPRLHGIETLSERFGGRIAFWCPVDIQKTLQTRDPKRIRDEAKLLAEKLGGFGGGFIAGYYSGNEAIGLPPEVQEVASKAFVEFAAAPKIITRPMKPPRR